MKTVDIKGNPYIQVNERILHFRNNYEGEILTELLSNENGVCIFKASIYVNEKLVATGHAYEKEGSTFINKTSYIENCETSAVGRALGILGIGIETSVASAEEVGNAIAQQEAEKKKTKTSADFEKEVDLHGTSASIAKWEEKNKNKIRKELPLDEQKKLRKYIDQVKATLDNAKAKQASILDDDLPAESETGK